MSKRKMGIAVVIPSGGRPVPIEMLGAVMALSYPVGFNRSLFISKKNPDDETMTRDQQRETLAEKAIAVGAEFMMCFDDDTAPPAHAIQSLWYVLSQNPKAAICGGIYCTRTPIPAPIVFMEYGAGPFWGWTLGDVFKCKGVGTGCMMVRLSALKTIPRPWFKDFSTCTPGVKETIGEVELTIAGDSGTDDMYLCNKIIEAGYDVIAHGGVLPTHFGEDGTAYLLPNDSYPVVSYLEKKAAFEKTGQDARNLSMTVKDFE